MSVQSGPRPARTPPSYGSHEEERGDGWIAFAAARVGSR
jgi:hypothetical protein